MGRVDIGDGGPPLDLPDAWLPDWQNHVRAAVARGELLRREASALHMFRYWRGYRTDQWIADRTGLTPDHVSALRVRHAPHTNSNGLFGELTTEIRQKILGYPIDGGDEDVSGAAWQTGSAGPHPNPPRPVRLIVANPHTDDIAITITTLKEG